MKIQGPGNLRRHVVDLVQRDLLDQKGAIGALLRRRHSRHGVGPWRVHGVLAMRPGHLLAHFDLSEAQREEGHGVVIREVAVEEAAEEAVVSYWQVSAPGMKCREMMRKAAEGNC